MSSVVVSDETFLAVPAARLAPELAQPARWRRWWPDLRLRVQADRGVHGVRWTVSGPVVGTMELWLEPVGDGTVVHYFLHADLVAVSPRPARAARQLSREVGRRRRAAKTVCFELKAALEAGRAPGQAPAPSLAAGVAR